MSIKEQVHPVIIEEGESVVTITSASPVANSRITVLNDLRITEAGDIRTIG